MTTHTDYLWFTTEKRQEFIRITDEVAAIVKKSGVKEGMVLVSAMHITAAVYVNDWEDGLIHDFQVWLEKLAPSGLNYRHHQTGEDNADAHLKRTLMGHQVMLPITNGKLDLGPWEQVFYAEFDGQRRKRVVVKVMGNEVEVRVEVGVRVEVRARSAESKSKCERGCGGHGARVSRRPVVGVGAVVVQDGKALIVKRAHEPRKGEWSLPGRPCRAGRDAGRRDAAGDPGGDRARGRGRPARRSASIASIVSRAASAITSSSSTISARASAASSARRRRCRGRGVGDAPRSSNATASTNTRPA